MPALKPETLCTQWRVAAAVKRGCQLGRMSWRGWRLDTLCVPDGGDTVYEVEGDGVGGRGHGLWREGFVRREGKLLWWWRQKKQQVEVEG